MILHIWYSTLIPASALQKLRERVLPLIQDICTKIQDKDEETRCSKVWTYGERSLRLTLLKRFWDKLLLHFEVPESLSVAQANTLRNAAVRVPSRTDYLERILCCQIPEWRVCSDQFLEDGILLPFGACRDGFDTPNPYVTFSVGEAVCRANSLKDSFPARFYLANGG